MNCDVCSEQVGEDKKYIAYITKRGQITLCTSCITKGVRNGSGSIVSVNGVISKPTFMFAGRDAEACEIAESEGWGTTLSATKESPIDEWRISEHWKMAQKHYWFCQDGEWYKDVSISGYDCFRKSCQAIRDYFGVWLESKKQEDI